MDSLRNAMGTDSEGTPKTLVVVVPGLPGSRIVFEPTGSRGDRTVLFSTDWKWVRSALWRRRAFGNALVVGPPPAKLGRREGTISADSLVPARPFGLPRRVVPDLAVFKGFEPLLAELRAIPGLGGVDHVVEYPYDWRKSMVDSATGLAAFCSARAGRLGTNTRVVIVAHSMGGIVAIHAIAEKGLNARWLITIGTPWQGTVKAAQFLVNGPIGLGWRARSAVRSMPGVREAIAWYPESWRGDSGFRLDASDLVSESARDGTDANAADIHTSAGEPLDLPVLAIIGTGISTPKRAARGRIRSSKLRVSDREDGDGTVCVTSAMPPIGGEVTPIIQRVRGDHDNLVAHQDVIEFVVQRVTIVANA
jgi:pimeloyl-ACP methyl ester carboxylesterase